MPAVTSVIHCDPDILSGEPVFVGTRVLLQNLIDYLAAGDSLEKFLDAFPSVTRQQAIAALEQAGEALADQVMDAGICSMPVTYPCTSRS